MGGRRRLYLPTSRQIMPSFTQVNVMGYLARAPEIKAGEKMNYTMLMIGVTKKFKTNNKVKKWVIKTQWIKVMFFGEMCNLIFNKFAKGDLVYVVGELQANSWDKDGVKQFDMYVLAKKILNITKNPRANIRQEPASEPGDIDMTDSDYHSPF